MKKLFELFKRNKKNKNEILAVEGIFPFASEANELAEKNKIAISKTYPVISDEEILKEINDAIIMGRKFKVFFNARINDNSKHELESKGYRVDFSGDNDENIHIYW